MASTVSVFDALSLIADFDDSLIASNGSSEKRRSQFIQHLQRMDKLNFKVPPFKEGLDWLNVSEPLSWTRSLKDQLVVLDFFTYCCVNCMHILPDLRALEEKYPPDLGIVVVGVHSAKFSNEKVTANILSAVLRYGIKHPVVNDVDATLWQELSISCWPTLMFIGPSNQLLYVLVGEGHRDELLEFVDIAKEFYSKSGQLKPKSIPIALEEKKVAKCSLSFPGKIYFWKEREWLVIADTGNHSIVIVDKNGVVEEVIGSGICGFKDGSFQEAEFSSPQGIGCLHHQVFVADTGNHAIRVIDLSTKTVRTIAGTGCQGTDKEGGKVSTQQEIASPWDLALGWSENANASSDPDLLYIAMAGTHQIWVLFLQDNLSLRGRIYEKETCLRFAGSGAEENRNNSYPEKAAFAQPSGLALSTVRNSIYIADSESSSIRSVELSKGKVSGVVGAEKDPKNLFASGDVDGKGVQAKLQHPLGVTFISPNGPLIVADSYNHKLKSVNLDTNTCESLSLTSQSPDGQNAECTAAGHFNEPGGLTADQDSGIVYVADTNNHAIKIVDFQSKTVSKLPIIFSDEKTTKSALKNDILASQDDKLSITLPDVTLSQSGDSSLVLCLPLPMNEGEHINLEAPNSYQIKDLDDSAIKLSSFIPEFHLQGKLPPPHAGNAEIIVKTNNQPTSGSCNFQVSVQLFTCLDQGNACLPPRTVRFKQTVHVK